MKYPFVCARVFLLVCVRTCACACTRACAPCVRVRACASPVRVSPPCACLRASPVCVSPRVPRVRVYPPNACLRACVCAGACVFIYFGNCQRVTRGFQGLLEIRCFAGHSYDGTYMGSSGSSFEVITPMSCLILSFFPF